MKIEGLKEVLRNLQLVHPSLGKAAERGLMRSGLLIQRESMQEVPVDMGNLKASAFTRKTKGDGFTANVQVGYTAAYAIYVHENLDAVHGAAFNAKYAAEIAKNKSKRKIKRATKNRIHSRGEGQKAKFLEDPARRNTDNIVTLVKDEVRNAVGRLGKK